MLNFKCSINQIIQKFQLLPNCISVDYIRSVAELNEKTGNISGNAFRIYILSTNYEVERGEIFTADTITMNAAIKVFVLAKKSTSNIESNARDAAFACIKSLSKLHDGGHGTVPIFNVTVSEQTANERSEVFNVSFVIRHLIN